MQQQTATKIMLDDVVVESLYFSDKGIVILPDNWNRERFLQPKLLGQKKEGFSLKQLSLFKNERKLKPFTTFSMGDFIEMYFSQVKDPISALGVRRINGVVNFGGLELFRELFGNSKLVLPRHAFEDKKGDKYVPYLFLKNRLGLFPALSIAKASMLESYHHDMVIPYVKK